jgi:N,N'-diacetyllegionaminate synthase
MNIIAEAGSNHNASVDCAIELIDIAIDAKADAVKFQFINPDGLYRKFIRDTDGHKIVNPAYQQRLKEVLPDEDWKSIFNYANTKRIDIFASVFDQKSVDLLLSLNCKTVKIASTDFTNLKLISSVISSFDKVIISTGMANLKELESTIDHIYKNRKSINQVSLMHCVSSYPCSLQDSNLNRIKGLRLLFDGEIGYSDHTLGSESAAIASFLGVNLFEKHITVDQSQSGFDHMHAMEREQFKQYCFVIREINQSHKGLFELSRNEIITKKRARRGAYASRPMYSNTVLTKDDISYLRPFNGVEFSDYESLIGSTLEEDIREGGSLGVKVSCINSNGEIEKEAIEYWTMEIKEKGM